MICKDNQPFSIVEDKGFKQLIQHLEPRYTMPIHKHISNDILPELYQEVETRVKDELRNADSIAVTSDLWTSTATDDYLSITVHFVVQDYKLQHICIEVIPFEEVRHTGENIANFLKKTLETWGLLDKINSGCDSLQRS